VKNGPVVSIVAEGAVVVVRRRPVLSRKPSGELSGADELLAASINATMAQVPANTARSLFFTAYPPA